MSGWLYPNGARTEPKLGSDPYFGYRDPISTPGGTTGSFHTGVDYVGFPTVSAVGPGTVIYAARNDDYGNEVRVRHDGFVSRYAHLGSIRLSIRVGVVVVAGTPLGPMGDTGKARGVHLHLRFDRNGSPFDPRPELARLVGGGGAAGSAPTDPLEETDMPTNSVYYRDPATGGIFGRENIYADPNDRASWCLAIDAVTWGVLQAQKNAYFDTEYTPATVAQFGLLGVGKFRRNQVTGEIRRQPAPGAPYGPVLTGPEWANYALLGAEFVNVSPTEFAAL